MHARAVGVNPSVLRWARERAAYSIQDIADRLDKKPADVESWESGKSVPTYVQLETLAYCVYKRPIALFFFPAPPDEPDPKQSFRTLPDSEIEKLAPDTRYAIREAEAMQIALRELNDGANPSERKIFRDLQVDPTASARTLASQVREYLGVDLEQQTLWKTFEDALAEWRNAIQEHGVFVFKRSFRRKRETSGFCLHDDEFPVIYLNNSDPKTRQIFTLFHELAHVLLGTNGITKWNDRYIKSLKGEEKKIEVLCNRFANEILVPSDDFEQFLKGKEWDDDRVAKSALRYKVSRHVILLKLLDRNLIDRDHYESKVAEYNKDYEDKKRSRKGGGGDYYRTEGVYLGKRFLELAFSKYYQQRITLEQLADYLNVKGTSVPGLEEYLWGKVPSS